MTKHATQVRGRGKYEPPTLLSFLSHRRGVLGPGRSRGEVGERERPVRNKLCSFRGLNPKLHMRSWEGGACTYDVRTGSGGGTPKAYKSSNKSCMGVAVTVTEGGGSKNAGI